jgi:anti-anti-sigma regulatory factor
LPEAKIMGCRLHYHLMDGYAIIRPEQACNEKTTKALAALSNSSLIESKNIILDLSHTKYVESPGFRWILRQFQALENAGKYLVVTGLPSSALKAFRLLRLDEHVPSAIDVRSALASLP